MLKLYFYLLTICHNSDKSRTTLIILRELMNTNNANTKKKNIYGLLNALTFVHEMSVDIIKFFCNCVKLVHKARVL